MEGNMLRPSISRLLLLLVIALAIAGCVVDGSSFPTGEYLDSEGHITNFMEGGTFTLRLTNGTVLVEEGRYSIEGDIISMSDEFCPPVEGVYKWTNQGGNLLFELVEDDCTDRASSLNTAVLVPLDAD
jgi:hypothetical protein